MNLMLPRVTHPIPSHFIPTNRLARKQPFDMLQQKQAQLGKGLAQRLGGNTDAKALNIAATSVKVAHIDFLTRGADSNSYVSK
jgi:hypothetical protein